MTVFWSYDKIITTITYMKSIVTLLASLAIAGFANAHVNTIVVDIAKKGATIQPTMYGLFFEDINYGADGGLYAEMVKNRSFEFPQSLMGWKTYGNVKIMNNDGPFNRNPHYVRLSYAGHPHKRTGLENEGFFGFSTQKGKTYRFSVWARVPQGGTSAIDVNFVNPSSMGETHVIAEKHIDIEGVEWKKYEVEISANNTVKDGLLRIFLASDKSIDLEHISCFPKDTWKGRENGLRADLAQALADIKPGIFRFPGGCIVEGTDLESRYQWKNSVGPVENRPLNENRWHYTFPHRFYPDYYQSYGLGFFEFFQLCEDINCEPLPVISCGLACQFQNENKHFNQPDMEAHVALDNLQPYIDDALDLIEFANGSSNTKWGKVRAEMGHAEPFNLKFLAIGNEQWDYKDNPVFTERLKKFNDAIRAKYPNIKLIGTTGPDSEGEKFDMLQPKMKELNVDLYDEHFYRPESWFLTQGNRYDNYDRKGPKVFAGEYACHGKGKKWNHFEASLLEAAFMTGLERNADIVNMATYAPLFAHIEGWQWRPDMIWYDNFTSVRTASYYVQQLFSLNKGTNVIKLTMNGKAVAGNPDQKGLFASAVYDATDDSYIIKIVNIGGQNQDVDVNFKGLKKGKAISKCTLTTLHCDNPDADNINISNKTLTDAKAIVPVTSDIAQNENVLRVTISASTFCIYRIKF